MKEMQLIRLYFFVFLEKIYIRELIDTVSLSRRLRVRGKFNSIPFLCVEFSLDLEVELGNL